MKVSRILCIIGLCILTPLFVFLLVFPKCNNVKSACAYEVEQDTFGYVSKLLDGGYFYFDNNSFDDDLSTTPPVVDPDLPPAQPFADSTEYRTILPSSINFMLGKYSLLEAKYGIDAVYSTAGSYNYPTSSAYGFQVTTDKFKPNNSSIDPYLYFTTSRYFNANDLYYTLRNFEIGLRSNTTINYKLNMYIESISSRHIGEDGNPTSKSIEIKTDFLKYISLKDYVDNIFVIYHLFDYDYNNNDNHLSTNIALIEINFRLYMYDPTDKPTSSVFFSTTVQPYNEYVSFIKDNAPRIFNYTIVRNPSPTEIIFNGVYAFFNLEIFPNFYLYYIVAIAIGGVMVGMVVKLFLGG